MVKTKEKLVIIAEDVVGEALSALVVNKMRGVLDICDKLMVVGNGQIEHFGARMDVVRELSQAQTQMQQNRAQAANLNVRAGNVVAHPRGGAK